ncbi:hypothetical protein C9374_010919 [Naegleria lovaniensis]|uniref:BTB domain-containing protein n=1 Tax=Naegleria lovaniensis TaxID=51637 RepID=A0AA88GFG3_NAELO|nr:uncharacterized protein C9374_010919 [Naegleria lovaniensis]KAG2374349.1 hypothetical protein C9374_010919 [Naegleria lovaniensis]
MGRVFVWGDSHLPKLVNFALPLSVKQVLASGSNDFYILLDGGELYRFKLIKKSYEETDSPTPGSTTSQDPNESEFANISTPELITLREEDLATNEHLIMIVCLHRSQLIGLSNLGKLFWLKDSNQLFMTFVEDKGIDHSKIVKISGDGCDSFVIHYASGALKQCSVIANHTISTIRRFQPSHQLLCTNDFAFHIPDETCQTLQFHGNTSHFPVKSNELNCPDGGFWVGGSVKEHHVLFLSSLGNVYSLGMNYETMYCGELILRDNRLTLVPGLRDIIKVSQCKDCLSFWGSNKHYFCAALTKNGEVFTWGGNGDKNLGHSPTKPRCFFGTLVTAFYGQKIDQIDCGSTVAIAYAKDSGTVFSQFINNEEFSDLKLELRSYRSQQTKEIYLHKCILLARCPTLLQLVESKKLNRFLRGAIFGLDSHEQHCKEEYSTELDATCKNSIRTVVTIDCTLSDKQRKEWGCEDGLKIIYDSICFYLSYLYTDQRHFDTRKEKDQQKARLINLTTRKMIELFYYLESQLWNGKTQISQTTISETLISDPLLESYLTWSKSKSKYENLSKDNRQTRGLFLYGDVHIEDPKIRKSRIAKHLHGIFSTPNTYEDCTLQMTSKSGELCSLSCHRVVLSLSEFFKSLFVSNMQENSSDNHCIKLDRNEFDDDNYLFNVENLLPMIYFLYCGERPCQELWMGKYDTNLSTLNACECLAVGNYFTSRPFKTFCETYISKYIDLETIVSLLTICDVHAAYSLREMCLNFAVEHFEQVYIQKSFHEELEPDTRTFIIKLAKKRGKKVMDQVTLKKLWNGEHEIENHVNETTTTSSTPKSTVPTSTANTTNSTTRNSTTSTPRKKFSFLSWLFKHR